MKFTDDGISILDILGEEKKLNASVKSVDFIKHTVTVEMHT